MQPPPYAAAPPAQLQPPPLHPPLNMAQDSHESLETEESGRRKRRGRGTNPSLSKDYLVERNRARPWSPVRGVASAPVLEDTSIKIRKVRTGGDRVGCSRSSRTRPPSAGEDIRQDTAVHVDAYHPSQERE